MTKSLRTILVVISGLFIIAGTVYATQATAESAAYKFLEQLVGEWESESEIIGDPAQPPMKFKGTETGRAIGESWVVLEIKGDSPMGPMTGILSLGYDSEKKKVIGTWIDSAWPTLWIYEGELGPDGKTLTLSTEGPNPMMPGKTAKFREQIEFKNKNERVFTSSMQGENGEWTTFVTVNAKRKS